VSSERTRVSNERTRVCLTSEQEEAIVNVITSLSQGPLKKLCVCVRVYDNIAVCVCVRVCACVFV